MPNYQEGKIYKIYNTINDDIYIGSTTQKLCERMSGHRRTINHLKKKHLPLYKSFIEHGVDNYYIELIEKCPCNDVDELRKKEGEYIKNMKPTMNTRVPGRSDEDSRKTHREKNKELTAQRKTKKVTCECGREVCYDLIQRHRRTKIHIELMNELN